MFMDTHEASKPIVSFSIKDSDFRRYNCSVDSPFTRSCANFDFSMRILTDLMVCARTLCSAKKHDNKFLLNNYHNKIVEISPKYVVTIVSAQCEYTGSKAYDDFSSCGIHHMKMLVKKKDCSFYMGYIKIEERIVSMDNDHSTPNDPAAAYDSIKFSGSQSPGLGIMNEACAILEFVGSIRQLNVVDGFMQSMGMYSLCRLAKNTDVFDQLERLDVSGNSMELYGLKWLLPILTEKAPLLSILNISNNHMEEFSTMNYIVDLLLRNIGRGIPTQITLANSNVDDKCIRTFSDKLLSGYHNMKRVKQNEMTGGDMLLSLDLNGNRKVTLKGSHVLAKAFNNTIIIGGGGVRLLFDLMRPRDISVSLLELFGDHIDVLDDMANSSSKDDDVACVAGRIVEKMKDIKNEMFHPFLMMDGVDSLVIGRSHRVEHTITIHKYPMLPRHRINLAWTDEKKNSLQIRFQETDRVSALENIFPLLFFLSQCKQSSLHTMDIPFLFLHLNRPLTREILFNSNAWNHIRVLKMTENVEVCTGQLDVEKFVSCTIVGIDRLCDLLSHRLEVLDFCNIKSTWIIGQFMRKIYKMKKLRFIILPGGTSKEIPELWSPHHFNIRTARLNINNMKALFQKINNDCVIHHTHLNGMPSIGELIRKLTFNRTLLEMGHAFIINGIESYVEFSDTLFIFTQ